MPAPTKVTVVRISFALINISHKPEAINSFRFVPLRYDTLSFSPPPPKKSEFVESERKFNSDRFRHFIYVKLRTAVGVCKNLPITCKSAYKSQKNTKFFCPLLDISVSGSPVAVPGVRLAVGAAALHTDRGHSLPSLPLPPAAVGSLPHHPRRKTGGCGDPRPRQ